MPVRFFTHAEAVAVLPRLRPLLAALRDAHHAFVFAREQVEELRRMHGAPLDEPSHPDHDEARRWTDEARRMGLRVEGLLAEAQALGAEVKDPTLGLVDFYAQRADGEAVYLCYRDDEATITHWHALTTGYQGRRPMAEF